MLADALPVPEELVSRRGQMFPALGPAQVARVATLGREHSYSQGTILWDQGDAGVPFFVVVEGQLEIVHPRGGSEQLVTVHGPGEFTGEMAHLLGRRSLVRARARTPLRVIGVEWPGFRKLVQTDPEISEVVMRAFILRRVALLAEGWGDAVVVGSQNSAATLRLQAFLVKNGQPYRYLDVDRDPDVQAVLDQFHVRLEEIPILICRGQLVLRNPSDQEVAECLGLNPRLEPSRLFDVVICGAGPSGLAAAVYAASEGLDVMVVEASSPGGQAGSSSKIENYLGFPTGISGRALSARAVAQAEKFGATISVARAAGRLSCEETGARLELCGGESVLGRSVILATGARYRKLEVPSFERFEGVGVYYAATFVEAQRCGPEEVVVVGGGNSAGQAAIYLAMRTARVHMIVRGPDLSASMSRYLVRRIEESPAITLHRRTRVTAVSGRDHLEEVTCRDETTGDETTRPIRHLFCMAGASPNTDWLGACVAIDDKGFVLTGADLGGDALDRARWPLARRPYLFETSHPKVFAVGDVRAGSIKRVASAVGEGSVCVQLVHKVLAE